MPSHNDLHNMTLDELGQLLEAYTKAKTALILKVNKLAGRK